MILFEYTHLHEEVRDALARHAPGARLTYVGADNRAPWRAVRDAWACEGDLTLIEQHAVLGGFEIPGFQACRQPWCTQLSEVVQRGNWTREGLTVARFTREFRAAIGPEDIEAVWGSCFECSGDGTSGTRPSPGGPGCWRHMSGALVEAARREGWSPHCHSPEVFHWKVRLNGGLACPETRGETVSRRMEGLPGES